MQKNLLKTLFSLLIPGYTVSGDFTADLANDSLLYKKKNYSVAY